MKLEELRKDWEKTLKPLCVIKDRLNYRVLVVLEKEAERLAGFAKVYHCHRYFQVGANPNEDEWGVSVDGQRLTLDQVWKWLESPKAHRWDKGE